MSVATAVLAAVNVVLLIWLLWVASNIRDDQLIIRTWIAHELRERRAEKGAPVDDEAFYKWLRDHPDRPYRGDPPFGPGAGT